MEFAVDGKTSSVSGKKARIALAWQIVVGLVIGVGVGVALNQYPSLRTDVVANVLQPAGDAFIKLIRMLVVPLVFTSMVVGIAGASDGRTVGRIGLKTLIYFEVVTSIAILVGLAIGNLLQPGVGTDMSQLGHVDITRYRQLTEQAQGHKGLVMLLTTIIPDNIVASMAKGDLLPVIFFAILFGFGLQSVGDEYRKPVLATFKGIAEALYRVTNIVMHYAPIGVCALIAVTVSTFGFGSLIPLVKLIAVTYFALFIFVAGILGVTARLFGFRIMTLIRVIKDELIIAFSTASSATVLPQLMRKVERLGVPPSITTFVVPTGYSFNLDGASIFLGIGALFVAQLYGIHLGWREQLVLTVTMVVTSKGAAAVPGFMFVIMLATLASAGLPLEGLAMIAGVDRVMDMGRTATNVIGNALAPLIIAKWEGQYDSEKGQSYIESLSR